MVAQYEAPTLNPLPREAVAPPGRGKHGYYKNARGWVVVQSTTSANRSGTEYKGGRFLPQYGEFMNGTAEPRAAALERDANGVPWNPAMEPWRLLFQKGGAKEFPVDQVIAYGWHLRPPYREVTFPQLEGVVIYDLECPECDRVFSSQSERQVAQFLRTHLTAKTNEAHSYTPQDLRELGQEWNINFETARNRVARRRTPERSLTPEPAPTLTPNDAIPRLDKFTCEFCGWKPPVTSQRPQAALTLHRRTHERVPAEVQA